MDQISGFLPQMGWSPLLMAATPKKAPASTVEPAAKPANTNAGLSGDADWRTPGDHAQAARVIESLAVARLAAARTGPEKAITPPPDPEAPTGPAPTFDVTPIEAAVAQLLAVPDLREAPAPEQMTPQPGAAKTQARETPPGPEATMAARAEAARVETAGTETARTDARSSARTAPDAARVNAPEARDRRADAAPAPYPVAYNPASHNPASHNPRPQGYEPLDAPGAPGLNVTR